MSYRIAGGDFDSAGAATRQLKEQLVRIGVGAGVIRRVMIASYEAEMNVVIHARTGTLWARLEGQTLDLEVADEGPGIPDVEKALTEGWSTASEKARALGFGAGMGLPNIRRNSDYFEIETRIGRGTRVRSRIRLEGLPAASDGGVAEEGTAEEWPALEAGKCRRCLRCIFACPAGALRVHESGPSLIRELCVGCTACATACTSGVYGLPDGSTIAARGTGLPAPDGAVLVLPRAFLCSFGAEAGPDRVLERLSSMGFAAVRFTEEWEEAVLTAARAAADAAVPGDAPVIPPVCPAVVALVESRFPSLIPSLGPWMTPIEAAGEEFPLQPVVVVAACPSQYGRARASSLSGRLTLLSPRTLTRVVRDGLDAAPARSCDLKGRAPCGDPSAPFTACVEPEQAQPGTLRVTGVRHVLTVLAAAEAGALAGTRLLDLSLCDTGCSGSPLLCADPYLAAARALSSETGAAGETVPRRRRALAGRGETVAAVTDSARALAVAVNRRLPWSQRPGLRLDPDMGKAIQKLAAIDARARALPGRDCGACGAPTCAAFAEDVVLGRTAQACPHAGLDAEPRAEPRTDPDMPKEDCP